MNLKVNHKFHIIIKIVFLSIFITMFGFVVFYMNRHISTLGNLPTSILGLAFPFLIVLGTIFAYLETTNKNNLIINLKEVLIKLIVIMFSAFLVYFVTIDFNVNKVIVVSLISLLVELINKKYSPSATLGAFIGMCNLNSSNYLLIILIASLVAIIVEQLSTHLFKGLGGKLGSIACISGLTAYLMLNQDVGLFVSVNNRNLVYIFSLSLVCSIATYLINNKLKKGPIFSYAIVSLSLSLLSLFSIKMDHGLLASVIIGSSFMGMSSKENIEVYWLVPASLIFSFLYTYNPIFMNVGGRLGLLSLISIFSMYGIKKLIWLIKVLYHRAKAGY